MGTKREIARCISKLLWLGKAKLEVQGVVVEGGGGGGGRRRLGWGRIRMEMVVGVERGGRKVFLGICSMMKVGDKQGPRGRGRDRARVRCATGPMEEGATRARKARPMKRSKGAATRPPLEKWALRHVRIFK